MALQSNTGTVPADRDLEKLAQRSTLKSRHSQALSQLMGDREDLRGVHALADFVDDALRWTA